MNVLEKILVVLLLLGVFFDQAIAQLGSYPTDAHTECAQLTTASGSVRTTNFPRAYPDNWKECWLITTAVNTFVQINIPYMKTERHNDTLRIYDGDFATNIPMRELSGEVYPGRMSTTSNYMLLAFTTNNIYTGDTGFEGDYRTVPK